MQVETVSNCFYFYLFYFLNFDFCCDFESSPEWVDDVGFH